MLGLDRTSQLNESGLSNHPSDQTRIKVVCRKLLTTVTESMTAQPPGFHHSALQVATNGQQVAPLRGSYPSAEMQSVYSTVPANTTAHSWREGSWIHVWNAWFRNWTQIVMSTFYNHNIMNTSRNRLGGSIID